MEAHFFTTILLKSQDSQTSDVEAHFFTTILLRSYNSRAVGRRPSFFVLGSRPWPETTTTTQPTQATGAEERPRSSKFHAAGTTFRKKIALSRRRRDGGRSTSLYLCSKIRFGPKNFLPRIRCTGTVFRNKMSLARRRHARSRYETLYLCSKVRFLVRGVALQKRCCDPCSMARSAGS